MTSPEDLILRISSEAVRSLVLKEVQAKPLVMQHYLEGTFNLKTIDDKGVVLDREIIIEGSFTTSISNPRLYPLLSIGGSRFLSIGGGRLKI